jgi:hypothetical protein
VLGSSVATELIDKLWRLEDLSDVSRILPLRSALLGAAQ